MLWLGIRFSVFPAGHPVKPSDFQVFSWRYVTLLWLPWLEPGRGKCRCHGVTWLSRDRRAHPTDEWFLGAKQSQTNKYPILLFSVYSRGFCCPWVSTLWPWKKVKLVIQTAYLDYLPCHYPFRNCLWLTLTEKKKNSRLNSQKSNLLGVLFCGYIFNYRLPSSDQGLWVFVVTVL